MRLPALLVLAGLTACAESPRDLIVGHWRPREDWAAIVDANWRATVGPVAQADGAVPTAARIPPPAIEEVFHADGTYGFSGSDLLGQSGQLTWSLVRADATNVVVMIQGASAAPGARREFVFESSDVMREVGGLSDGVRMRRVR